METSKILTELRTERDRIDKAIAALTALDGTGSAAVAITKAQRRGRRGMSPASRKRLSERMKARWSAWRKNKAKPISTKKGAHKPMSAATKKRLSLLAKRRWAARKKAAKT